MLFELDFELRVVMFVIVVYERSMLVTSLLSGTMFDGIDCLLDWRL